MSDPYKTLGLKRNATHDQVRAAFRKLSRTRHPDMPGGSQTAFTELNEAHSILSDPKRREWWDQNEWDCGSDAQLATQGMMMLQNIMRIILIQDPDPTKADLVQSIRQHLDKERAGLEHNLLVTARARRRIDQLRERFSVDGESLVDKVLAAEVNTIEHQQKQMRSQMATNLWLNTLLSKYKFRWDQVVQHPYAQFVNVGQQPGFHGTNPWGTARTR